MRRDRLDYWRKSLKTMSPSKEKLDMSVPSVMMLCEVCPCCHEELWDVSCMSLGAEGSRT